MKYLEDLDKVNLLPYRNYNCIPGSLQFQPASVSLFLKERGKSLLLKWSIYKDVVYL